MSFNFFTVSFCFLLRCCQSFDSQSVSREKMTKVSGVTRLHSSGADETHEIVIAVKQKNLDELHDLLMERSTPNSNLYQEWLSSDELNTLTHNNEAVIEIQQWLSSFDVSITHKLKNLNYIHAQASIKIWENVLQTKFHYWKDTRDMNGKVKYYHRSEGYTIPSHLDNHILAIFKTSQIPPRLHHHGKLIPKPQDVNDDNNNHYRSNTHKDKFDNNGDDKPLHDESMDLSMSSISSQIRRKDTSCSTNSPCQVTVNFLNNLYSISTNLADSSFYQAVFQTSDETFSQNDLNSFQKKYGLTIQQAKVKNTVAGTCSDPTKCSEGNLDLQYIMGVAQAAVGVFWYTDEFTTGTEGDSFLDFLLQVYNTPDATRPTSLSISWGAYERDYRSSYGYIDSFNIEAQKLGLMGVTIFASSGDDGVSGYSCNCTVSSSSSTLSTGFWLGTGSWSGNGYFPFHPASSPYVVSVGATMGPHTGGAEIACQSQLGGVITSGGGFSTHNKRPSYQDTAVTEYLSSTAGGLAASGYNPKGRGYPDISFIGVNYPVIINGVLYSVAGTSASAPVAAAMITLINALRKAQGKNNTVGFIHPTLYAAAVITNITNTTTNITTLSEPVFTDITSGHNKCCSSSSSSNAVCCASGFTATSGWDPATGLGSISYAKLASIFNGTINATHFTDKKKKNSALKFSILQIVGLAIGAASVLLCLMVILVRLCLKCSYWCSRSSSSSRNSSTITTTQHPSHYPSHYPNGAHVNMNNYL